MNRMKKFLFAGGSAVLLLAGITLLSAPPTAEAAYRSQPEECTFCSAREETCRIGTMNGYRTCYYRMSGPGTCPPCTPCERSGLIDPWE